MPKGVRAASSTPISPGSGRRTSLGRTPSSVPDEAPGSGDEADIGVRDAVAGHLVTQLVHLLPAPADGPAVHLAAVIGLDYVAPPDRRPVRRVTNWRPSLP